MGRKVWRLVVALEVYRTLKRLSRPERAKLVGGILALVKNPHPKDEERLRLRGPGDAFLRLRVVDYRVMYEVGDGEVRILGFTGRKDLERWVRKL